MNWKNRIVSNPAIMVGKPTIKGTRITVELVLDKLSNGKTFEEILKSHPTISMEDIQACLAYATESVKNVVVYEV